MLKQRCMIMILAAITASACNGVGTANFEGLTGGSTTNGSGTGGGGGSSGISFSGLTTIDQVTDTTIRLNWTSHPDAVAYQILNMSIGSAVYERTVNAPASNVTLTSLTSNHAYSYRVRAIVLDGSIDTNTMTAATTTHAAPNVPSAITRVTPATASGFTGTPTFQVGGVKDGDVVKLYSDACVTEVASGTATGLTINLTTSMLSVATYTLHAKAVNAATSVASTCSTVSISYTKNGCPGAGYSAVPGNATYGTSDFCVMTYEAKNDGSGNAISTAGTTPWVSINRADAQAKCAALGSGYDLLSNPEFMTIATDAESQGVNWYGGVVGVNCLMRGNQGITNDCTYDGSNPEFGTSRSSKAQLTLSNGSVVWDIAGNVNEWVDWRLTTGMQNSPTNCVETWTELENYSCSGLGSTDYMPRNPAGVSGNYSSLARLGFIDGGNNGGASVRGGDWGLATYAGGSYAGLFTLLMNKNPGMGGTDTGFRCVFRP